MVRFGDLPSPFSYMEKSRIVLVSVPYDETSTWMKGSAKGPSAIMEASRNLELYDTETEGEVYRHGIYTDDPLKVPSSAELMVNHVRQSVRDWLNQGKFVVTIGGEHSVSVGAVRAHHEIYAEMSVLQLDAHADLRQDYQGSPYNHACTMARIRELCPITQVGIRSMDIEETKYMDQNRIFFQERIIQQENWIDKVIETLSDKVYLTLDLDVLDPSIMPSTGTPEPGGMDWYTILTLIRRVTEKKELIGFDVVELCPSKQNRAPDFLAAKLIYKILGYRFNT
jgi:agmatinase